MLAVNEAAVASFAATLPFASEPGRQEYPDRGKGAVSGLSLRVGTQAKSWAIVYRFGGHQVRMTLGTYPEMAIDDARKRAAEVKAQARKGIDPRLGSGPDTIVSAEGKPSLLYRHFDAKSRLLYVGVSMNAVTRLAQHKDSGWFSAIRRVTIQHYPSREMALAAEREAIKTELPAYNIKHVPRSAGGASVGGQSPHAPPPLSARRQNEESRRDLTKRLVAFQPMYTRQQASEILLIGMAALNRLIEAGKIGHVLTPGGKPRVAITGWQLLEYIEALEAETAATAGWRRAAA